MTEDHKVDTIGWSMPAFPSQPWNGEGYPCGEMAPGLTKRELIAAKILQGFASTPDGEGFEISESGERARLASIREKAKAAVEWADALLQELAK